MREEINTKSWVFWTGNIHWSRIWTWPFCIPPFPTTTGLSHWFLCVLFCFFCTKQNSFSMGDSPEHASKFGSYDIHMRSVRTGFKCLPENTAAKCLTGRYPELLSWKFSSPCKDNNNNKGSAGLSALERIHGWEAQAEITSPSNTDVDASSPVFKTEMMGGENLDLLKACSAEAVTLPGNDPQLTEGDHIQPNASGRLSWIISSQHFKILVS